MNRLIVSLCYKPTTTAHGQSSPKCVCYSKERGKWKEKGMGTGG